MRVSTCACDSLAELQTENNYKNYKIDGFQVARLLHIESAASDTSNTKDMLSSKTGGAFNVQLP